VRVACDWCEGATRTVVVSLLTSVMLVALAVGPAHGRLLRVLDDPSGSPGGEFGQALVGVGLDLAVGAPGTQVLDHDGAGVVRLYTVDGVLRRTLEAQNPAAGAAFGSMVAAGDGILYVGAPGDPSTGVGGVGAVYVFDAAGGALLRILRAPDANTTTAPSRGGPTGSPGVPQSTAGRPEAMGFGQALTVVGNRVVVGAPGSTVDGLAGAGAVYVFDTGGTLLRSLREFSPHVNAFFGASMTLIGGVLFVGAPGTPSDGVDSAGVVRAFDAATGASLFTLRSALPVEGAALGVVVGQIGGTLFVGAPGDSSLGEAAGAVYLFDPRTTALLKIITPPTASPALDFGRAVVAIGGNLLVGADGAGPSQSGKAWLIDAVTSEVRTTFTPTITRAGGHFGFALAALGPAIAIGEPAPGVTSGSGRVHLFDLAPAPPGTAPQRTRTIDSPAPAPPPAGCVSAPTTESVDCRLEALLATVREVGLGRLASPLRRARRELRRAERTRGPHRVEASRLAVRGMGHFARRLERAVASVELRDTLLAAANSVEADLRALAGAPTP
jgi:FG-GAP repeat